MNWGELIRWGSTAIGHGGGWCECVRDCCPIVRKSVLVAHRRSGWFVFEESL